MKWTIPFLLMALPATAADKALILNEAQQSAYRQILDAAIRANGLSPVSRNAFVLSDMLDRADIVTERKIDPPPPSSPPKDESQP